MRRLYAVQAREVPIRKVDREARVGSGGRSLSDSPGGPEPTRREQDLRRILQMLSGSPSVRSELVADVRQQVEDDSYLNEEKLNLAIFAMLRDVLGEPARG